MNEDAVLWLKQDVFCCAARQGLAQIDAEHLELAIVRAPKDLHVIQACFSGRAAGEVDCVAKISGSICNVVTRISHFSGYRDHRRIFEIESTEDAHGIERFQNKVLVFTVDSIVQVKSQNLWRV